MAIQKNGKNLELILKMLGGTLFFHGSNMPWNLDLITGSQDQNYLRWTISRLSYENEDVNSSGEMNAYRV